MGASVNSPTKKGFLVLRSLLSSADNGGSGQGQCCLSVVRHVQFSKLCAFLSDRKHLDDGKLNRVSTRTLDDWR